MPIRVGLIGTGSIAREKHLPGMVELGGLVETVAVVDVNEERARSAAADYAVPHSYTDYQEMLEVDHPDLVLIATPPSTHRETVTAALDAGAWVACEKPPTLSLADYDAMSAHEKEGGPYVSFLFQHRWGSAARRLRELVAHGTLGRPLVATCNTLWYRDPTYFAVPWRAKWATEGGGPTMGHGIHQVDMLLSILGNWSDVSAEMATLGRDTETEDVSLAIARLENGAMVSVTNSLLSPRQTSDVRIDFEKATVEVHHLYGYDNTNWTWTPAPDIPEDEAASWLPRSNETSDTHVHQFRIILDAMERGERPPVSGADGRRGLEFAAGMYKSALTGRRVARSELTPDDPFYTTMTGGDASTATDRIHAGTILAPSQGPERHA